MQFLLRFSNPLVLILLFASALFVNQALLTGGPYPAEKHDGDLGGELAEPDEETNCVFMTS